MPTDEQGDKWACEPCIRGHRSTRCEHWDRFMLRVKKPGRPLSSCPHPKGNCPCGKEKVMMVRIPKASSCICAPAYSLGADGSSPIPDQHISINAETGLPYPLTYAGVPLNGTNGSSNPVPYRVQKGKKRSGSIVDPQAIARAFDTNGHYAIPVGSPTANGSSDSQSVSNNTGLSTTNMPGPANLELTRSMPQSWQSKPSFQSRSPSNKVTNGEESLQNWNAYHADFLIPPTGQDIYKQDVQRIGEPLPSLGESSLHSCCQPVRHTKDDTVSEQADIITKACTTNAVEERNEICLQEGHLLLPSASNDHNPGISEAAGYRADAQLPMSEIGMCSKYSFPSSYIPIKQPSNPKQPLGHQQTSPEISRSEPQWTYPSSGSAALSTGESLVQSPTHNCNCGDGCDCLGCAAHPYNATTRHHVEDLSRILADGYRSSPTYSPEITQDKADSRHQTTPLPSHISLPTFDDTSDTTRLANYDEEISTASPFVEQNQSLDSMFSSRDFYTMEFPLESTEAYYGCSDMSGTCMCGDDCTCIGCLTHSGHNGDGPLVESPNAETHITGRLSSPN